MRVIWVFFVASNKLVGRLFEYDGNLSVIQFVHPLSSMLL